MSDRYLIPSEKLRWTCPVDRFEFETTAELPDLDAAIGQQRALRSIDFGLGVKGAGFNLYLAGETGTGRTSTIAGILKMRAADEARPFDWVYANDFKKPDSAISLSLPAGMGQELANDMKELVDSFRKDIPKAFDSSDYANRRRELMTVYQNVSNELFHGLEKNAASQGFALQRTVSGLVIVPQKDGENYSQEEFDALNRKKREKIEKLGKALTEELNEVLRKVREQDKVTKDSLAQADRDLGMSCLGHRLDPLKVKYGELPKVIGYLEAVQDDILKNLDDFKPQQSQPQIPGIKNQRQEPTFTRYHINVIVDNINSTGAPVVFETNPTYSNLFGRIEHTVQYGGPSVTDFSMIRAGAMHRANGGYLVIEARQVLTSPFVWDSLKRSIRNREIKIDDLSEQYRFMTPPSLKPEPVQMDVKIVLIGTSAIYYQLFRLDPDYRKFFKVKAEFDSRIVRTEEAVHDYSRFIASCCRSEGLLPFDRKGVAALLEYAARMVEDQNRLSAHFMELSDFIRETNFWAVKWGRGVVSAAEVRTAAEESLYRMNRVEERMQDLIDDGTIMVDTVGAVVGQINGLSVVSLGDHTFGRPTRITATVYTGQGGMVNIEREVKLSGPIHDKGVLILTGYLGGTFAVDRPLSLSASICFEQSYDGIDGDSASSTELYSLLSALSGVPIRQGIAVTGSVNQRGMVQAIGGVNHKIEGFFAVCRTRGLTGDQGVLIPKANERNLMLNEEVVAAVKAGQFHIWSVETVEQGIEILTGLPAGEKNRNGSFRKGTLYQMVDNRLKTMADRLKAAKNDAKKGAAVSKRKKKASTAEVAENRRIK